ncbi:MAG: thioredoxin family protein [Desulfobacterales bacterium]
MKIEILGPGCKRCNQLYDNTVAAVGQFAADTGIEVVKITDIKYFAQKGIFVTPGMIIDGEVISTGKVLPAEEIQKKIEEKL